LDEATFCVLSFLLIVVGLQAYLAWFSPENYVKVQRMGRLFRVWQPTDDVFIGRVFFTAVLILVVIYFFYSFVSG
jgi:hypothetical protein